MDVFLPRSIYLGLFQMVTYGLNFKAKVFLHLKHGASWCLMPLEDNPSATRRARAPNLLILKCPI